MTNYLFKNFLKGLIASFIIALAISFHTATNASLHFYYEMTNLGTLGGNSSVAYDINDVRQVVGESKTSSGFSHAFLWQNNKMTDLGTLNGYENSCAVSINKIGQIVGYSYNTNNTEQRAFLWENNQIRDLGTIGGSNTKSVAINNQGQIVGTYNISSGGFTHSFLWKNGEMTDLGIPTNPAFRVSDFQVSDINDRGQMVGQVGSGIYHSGYLLENGNFTNLGSLSTQYNYPLKINKIGQILAYKDSGNASIHALIIQNGTQTELMPFYNDTTVPRGSLSVGFDLNNLGRVVGISSITTQPFYDGKTTAFFWRSPPNITQLIPQISPNSRLSFDQPTALNNRGYIVGNGTSYGGNRALLLTPVLSRS